MNRPGLKFGLLYFLFFAVAVNIPMWVTAYLCRFALHGWLSLDFILVGILGVFLPRPVAAVLLGTATIADATAAIAETYFLSGNALFENAFAMDQFGLNRVLVIVATIALQACCVIACLKLPSLPRHLNLRLKIAASLAIFWLVVVGLQYVEEFPRTGKLTGMGAYPSTRDAINRTLLDHVHLVRSGARFWFRSPPDCVHLAARSPEFWKEKHPGATASLFQLVSNTKADRPDVVVILLESWGLSFDAQIHGGLVSDYTRPEITSRYQVEQGTVPFWGSTDGGEARELCSSISLPGYVAEASPGMLDCLPQKLRSLGYRTMAVHGMSGFLYNRAELYPRLGFEELWFRNQFDAAQLPRCPGAFRGTCDAAVADWIHERLQERGHGPQFIYWVTLGSHLPVPSPPSLKDPASCTISPALAQDIALCTWYQLVFDVHRSVFDMATAALARPTIFVVVGDHAPPFSNPLRRNDFSNSVVPYILLIPRQIVLTPGSQLLPQDPPAGKAAGAFPTSPANSKRTAGP